MRASSTSGSTRSWPLSAEAGPATAGATGVGVVDRKAGLVEAIFVVERGALQHLCGLCIDHDVDGGTRVSEGCLLVVGGDVAVEEHLVGEATAAARAHSNAQRQVEIAFCFQQFLDLDGGGIGERDHVLAPPGGRNDIVTGYNRTIGVVIPGPPDVETITELLRSVIDPELGADIVTLGMVPSITVSAERLGTVGVKLTIWGCPLRAQIKKDIETRVAVHPGLTKFNIDSSD